MPPVNNPSVDHAQSKSIFVRADAFARAQNGLPQVGSGGYRDACKATKLMASASSMDAS
jgi:hypothetical protein